MSRCLGRPASSVTTGVAAKKRPLLAPPFSSGIVGASTPPFCYAVEYMADAAALGGGPSLPQ